MVDIGDYEKLGWELYLMSLLGYDVIKCFDEKFKYDINKNIGDIYKGGISKNIGDNWIIVKKYKFMSTGRFLWAIIIWKCSNRSSDGIWFEISDDRFSLVLMEIAEKYIEHYGFELLFGLVREQSSNHINVHNALDILLEEGAEL